MVTALDLVCPRCVVGDITAFNFVNNSFDLVFCAEVLEHSPVHLFETACFQLARVAKVYLLIGVPCDQDIRVGRTTGNCGKVSPPWGHVNSFNEHKLARLFPGFIIAEKSFVCEKNLKTNPLSCAMMDMAGNPYGTYGQEESCGHCGKKLSSPPSRTFLQKVLTKIAYIGMAIQRPFLRPHPNWIHLLLQKRSE